MLYLVFENAIFATYFSDLLNNPQNDKFNPLMAVTRTGRAFAATTDASCIAWPKLRELMMKTINCVVALILVLLAACGGGGNDTAPLPPQFLASTTTSSTEYKTVVQQLYISYFGRPADTGGLGSFQNQLAALRGPTDIQGLDKAYHTSAAIKSLVDSFGGSAESSALYSGDNTAFVTAIYKNILNRSPDSAGLAFWVGALNGGAATKANVSLSIMAGALINASPQGQLDAALVNRKVTVGTNFTDALVIAPVNGYSGDAAAAQARAMLTNVTASTDTTAFQANIAALVGKLAAPVANAGPNQNVIVGSQVTLDGSASAALGGKPLTYRWSFVSKPSLVAVLVNASSAKPTFIPDALGTYSVLFTVSDGIIDSISVVVINAVAAPSNANAAPIANAGPDQSVITGAVVILDGSLSKDPNGDTISYAWTLVSKPALSSASIVAPTSSKTTFVADVAGAYDLRLFVNDGRVSSTVADTISVVAVSPSIVVVADTGVYRCSTISKTLALSLYAQGHTYLDRDHDGKPCEANDISNELANPYVAPSTGSTGLCYVNGYYRASGTYVQGYYRACRS
jgi:hypothetical protein